MDDSELTTVATFAVRHEAEVARAALASAGIEALVIADDEGGLNPGFFSHYGVRLVVLAADADSARRLLGDGAG
jgi:hypothetical protein